MILFRIDEKTGEPKTRQIVHRLLDMMRNGVLKPDDRLPSTRRLAEVLHVHRSTVALAYQELWSLGYIELNRGTAPAVRDRVGLVGGESGESTSRVDWSLFASPATEELYRRYRFEKASPSPDSHRLISFERLAVDHRLFPLVPFRVALGKAFREAGESLMGYGDAQGCEELREAIAERMKTHGMSVSKNEILITNGAQHGIDLVLRMMVQPGRRVAVESPCYGEILPLLRHYALEIVEIPMRDDGMDLSILEKELRRTPLHLVYTMPNFQNPTGVTTNQPHRERLLALCERYGAVLLEDGFEEEMKYTGRVVLPIKSMDSGHRVLYCGTFSKVLFPGVRIGWLAAHPKCIQRLVALRRYGELAPPGLLQAALARFCSQGYYERHVTTMHRVFRKRMQMALAALERHVSTEWARWTKPGGGYLIWLSMAPHTPVEWSEILASEGVAATSGSVFFASKPAGDFFRLSISSLDEKEIEEGIRRLGRAFAKIYTERRT